MDAVRCARLTADCKCSIYKERFAEGQPAQLPIFLYLHKDELKSFVCSRIQDLITRDQLAPDVRAQCCYAHPELLERDYGSKTSDP